MQRMNVEPYDGGYFSHLAPLTAAISATAGPVLELGCGWGSTPVLSAMCHVMRRRLVTIETQQLFFERFVRTFKHEILCLGGDPDRFRHNGEFEQAWSALPTVILSTFWSVTFIDFYPGEARKDAIRLLADKSEIIIAHDAECDGKHGGGGNYDYDSVTPSFRYVSYYRTMTPVTLLLSNRRDVNAL